MRLGQTVPCPLVVFTHDTDADHIQQATDSGCTRLRGARLWRQPPAPPDTTWRRPGFRKHSEQQREAFEDVATRFEERKAVDRAKGILMRAQSLSDDDAFRTLRSAAMRLQPAHWASCRSTSSSRPTLAEAVNRSGQLRMLSQRLVKLHLLQAAGSAAGAAHAALLERLTCSGWIANFAPVLRKSLSQPTYGDLLEQVAQHLGQLLKAALAQGSTDVGHGAAGRGAAARGPSA